MLFSISLGKTATAASNFLSSLGGYVGRNSSFKSIPFLLLFWGSALRLTVRIRYSLSPVNPLPYMLYDACMQRPGGFRELGSVGCFSLPSDPP